MSRVEATSTAYGRFVVSKNSKLPVFTDDQSCLSRFVGGISVEACGVQIGYIDDFHEEMMIDLTEDGAKLMRKDNEEESEEAWDSRFEFLMDRPGNVFTAHAYTHSGGCIHLPVGEDMCIDLNDAPCPIQCAHTMENWIALDVKTGEACCAHGGDPGSGMGKSKLSTRVAFQLCCSDEDINSTFQVRSLSPP